MKIILELNFVGCVEILNFDSRECLFKSEGNDFFLDAYNAIKYYIDYLSDNTIALLTSESFDNELKKNNGILAFINEEGMINNVFNNKSMEIYIPQDLEINTIQEYKDFIQKK